MAAGDEEPFVDHSHGKSHSQGPLEAYIHADFLNEMKQNLMNPSTSNFHINVTRIQEEFC